MFRLPHRNKLERVSKSSMEGLFKLEKLKLSDNRIQALEEGAFDHLLSLARLEVGDNPLVCNCSLAWIFQWFKVWSLPSFEVGHQLLMNVLNQVLSVSLLMTAFPRQRRAF